MVPSIFSRGCLRRWPVCLFDDFFNLRSVHNCPERKALEEKLVEEEEDDDEDDSRYLNLEGPDDGKHFSVCS